MSNYDPPQQPWGGPPPQDQQPWGGPPPQDPYGAPQYPQDPGAQPGGYPPPPQPTTAFPGGGYQDPGYPPVSGAGGGFPPPGGGGFPPPGGGGFPPPPGGGFPGAPQPPSRGNSGKIIIGIVAVVVLALCCGGGYTAYRYASDDGNDKANPGSSASATPGATGTAGATRTPTATPTRTPTAAPTTAGRDGDDPDTFVKGDCFINEGTDSSPALKKVPCTTSGSYEVVAKIPGTSDKTRCDGSGVGRYDASYTHDESSGTINDYVLCLRKR